MNVQIKTIWANVSTGRKFMNYLVEIVFTSGAVDTAEAEKLYIDDKEIEPNFDSLYLMARGVMVNETTRVVKIYT